MVFEQINFDQNRNFLYRDAQKQNQSIFFSPQQQASRQISLVKLNNKFRILDLNKQTPMPKQKIDLQNLLAKYENTPAHYTQPDFGESRKQQMQVEQSFYGKRTYHPPENNSRSNFKMMEYSRQQPQARHYQTSTQGTFVGNFKMSQKQCESFLLEITKQLNFQKKQLGSHAQTAYKQITQRFNRNHDRIRKQIMELLDLAFKENEKMMKEELIRQARNEPTEFNMVKMNIQQMEEQITGYLRQLGGSQYRKAISQVVLKDYTYQMKKLQDSINDAKLQYIQNLGEIEPDTQRIQCLKNDLRHLFYFKKKTAKLIEKSLFSVLVPNNQQQMPQNNYNQSKYQQPPQAASRTRKSFFNFGS